MKRLIYIVIIAIGLTCCSQWPKSTNEQEDSADTTHVDSVSAQQKISALIDSLRDSISHLNDNLNHFANIHNVQNEGVDSLADSLNRANNVLRDTVLLLCDENDSLKFLVATANTTDKSLWHTIKNHWICLSLILLLIVCLVFSIWKPFIRTPKPEKEDKPKNGVDIETLKKEKLELDKECKYLEGENRRLEDEKNKNDREQKKLRQQLADAQNKINTIRQEVENEKNKEIERIKNDLTSERDKHKQTKRTLESTQQNLNQTSNALNQKKAELARLEEAQRVFTASLTSVPFAQGYAKKVEHLVRLVNDVLARGINLLNLPLDDYYYVMKALARYVQHIQSIETLDFSSEVVMPAKARFVFNDSQLAHFDQNTSDKDLQTTTMQYFFEKYLKKYINAAVVLNETLAGMHYLVPDLDVSHCKAFDDMRTHLFNACEGLGIQVVSAKIFEFVGQRIDLTVEKMVNAGIGQTGQILEIKNCQVSLIGANTPDDRISVIVQN